MSDAEVQTPSPRASALDVRVHQGESRPLQRTDDVPRARGGAERLLRLAAAADYESRSQRTPGCCVSSVRHSSRVTASTAPLACSCLREAGETCRKHRVARLTRQANLRALPDTAPDAGLWPSRRS